METEKLRKSMDDRFVKLTVNLNLLFGRLDRTLSLIKIICFLNYSYKTVTDKSHSAGYLLL